MEQEEQKEHLELENEMKRLGFKNFDFETHLQIRKKISKRYKQKSKQE